MQKTFNLAPIVFTIAVATGVLLHDVHLDKVATVAFAVPAALATYGAAHMVSGGNEHIHVERVSFSNQSRVFHSTLPKVTPRDNENRYIQPKKTIIGGDSTSLWPSV
jgi:hypothetical protein